MNWYNDNLSWPLTTFRPSSSTDAAIAPRLEQIEQLHLRGFTIPLGNCNSRRTAPQWQDSVCTGSNVFIGSVTSLARFTFFYAQTKSCEQQQWDQYNCEIPVRPVGYARWAEQPVDPFAAHPDCARGRNIAEYAVIGTKNEVRDFK